MPTSLEGNTDPATSSNAELQQRLASYGISALVLAGAMTAAETPADAAIVTYTVNPVLTTSVSQPAILFDFMNGQAALDNSFASPPAQFALYQTQFGTSTHTFTTGSGNAVHKSGSFYRYALGSANPLAAMATDGGGLAVRFNSGDLIGPYNPFANGVHPLALGYIYTYDGLQTRASSYAAWTPTPQTGFLGLAFTFGGPDIFFGWAEVTVNTDLSLTLSRFAYETNPFMPIVAGATVDAPDANPLLLLLAGGPVAMAVYRRRRTARSTDNQTVH